METFTVECTDNDKSGTPRTMHYTGTSYFEARDAFVKVACVSNRVSRFILCVETDERARVLSDSDTDNVIRVQRGLKPVEWVEAI